MRAVWKGTISFGLVNIPISLYTATRDVLKNTGKVGIAKVVIKTREHLAAVKARDEFLVLELMHFADELVEPKELHVPGEGVGGKKELEMARGLVESMTDEWEPEKYQ